MLKEVKTIETFSDLPKNNSDPSEVTTTNENIIPVQLPPAPTPVVLSVNADNQHPTSSVPTSQEFKFKLPNSPVVALSKTQLLAKKLNGSCDENVEPPKKKFKGISNNVAQKSIISPVRFISSSKKRKRMAEKKILSHKFKNDLAPDYVLSFIWRYWPEMIISNPHKDFSKRFLNKGNFACNSFFNIANSNYIKCTAPYEEVLQVLSAEKYALQRKLVTSQYYLTASQYNDAVNQFQCLSSQQSKVHNAIKQVVKLYGSFINSQCNFDARYINEQRYSQAVSVYPIIKSYEHFYGHA